MAVFELLRNADVPLRYDLGTIGSLTFAGTSLRKAAGAVDGEVWDLRKTGIGKHKDAYDAAGELVGTFDVEQWLRGGFGKGATLVWRGTTYVLRRSTKEGHTHELLDLDGQELFTLRARRWGAKREGMGTVWIDDLGAVEPALVLFATFAKFAEGKG